MNKVHFIDCVMLKNVQNLKYSSFLPMETSDWTYFAEGGHHIVLRYFGSNQKYIGKVLRLEKDFCFDKNSTIAKNYYTIIKHWISKIYLIHLDEILLSNVFLKHLNLKIKSNRPSHRLGNIAEHRTGFLTQDLTTFAHRIPESYATDNLQSCINVEFKVKSGFSSCSPFLKSHLHIKYNCGKYRIQQYVKLYESILLNKSPQWGYFNEVNNYNPADLCSQRIDYVHRAIDHLSLNPQNNLHVYNSNGTFLYGCNSTVSDNSVLEKACKDIFNYRSTSCNGDECKDTNSKLLFDVCSVILTNEPLLHNLQRVQALDILDVEGVDYIFHYLCYLITQEQKIEIKGITQEGCDREMENLHQIAIDTTATNGYRGDDKKDTYIRQSTLPQYDANEDLPLWYNHKYSNSVVDQALSYVQKGLFEPFHDMDTANGGSHPHDDVIAHRLASCRGNCTLPCREQAHTQYVESNGSHCSPSPNPSSRLNDDECARRVTSQCDSFHETDRYNACDLCDTCDKGDADKLGKSKGDIFKEFYDLFCLSSCKVQKSEDRSMCGLGGDTGADLADMDEGIGVDINRQSSAGVMEDGMCVCGDISPPCGYCGGREKEFAENKRNALLWVETLSVSGCVHMLCMWLHALAACDASVIINLKPIDVCDGNDSNPSDVPVPILPTSFRSMNKCSLESTLSGNECVIVKIVEMQDLNRSGVVSVVTRPAMPRVVSRDRDSNIEATCSGKEMFLAYSITAIDIGPKNVNKIVQKPVLEHEICMKALEGLRLTMKKNFDS